jgi:outer membrane immunogenic protein
MRALPIAAIVAAVSTTALTQIASAADQGPPSHKAPVYKAPPPPPAPIYTWTGWYVGGNVGYSWGDAHTNFAGSGTSIEFPLVTAIPNDFAFAASHVQHVNGFIGGGQFGYNYQVAPKWILGIEADIQGSGERGSSTFSDPFPGELCQEVDKALNCLSTGSVSGTATTEYEAKIDWFGTARGRIGMLVTDGLLLYGTGGLAFGRVSASGNFNVTVPVQTFPPVGFGPSTSAFSQSRTNTGFAVGGGLEGRFFAWLPPNWTWKLEYLHIDLGSIDTSTSFAAAPIGLLASHFTPLAGTMTTHTHFTDNIVRVGLNYQFH